MSEKRLTRKPRGEWLFRWARHAYELVPHVPPGEAFGIKHSNIQKEYIYVSLHHGANTGLCPSQTMSSHRHKAKHLPVNRHLTKTHVPQKSPSLPVTLSLFLPLFLSLSLCLSLSLPLSRIPHINASFSCAVAKLEGRSPWPGSCTSMSAGASGSNNQKRNNGH